MSTPQSVLCNGRWAVKFSEKYLQWPQSDRRAAQNWAARAASREQNYESLKQKLMHPTHAPQYKGIVADVQDLQPRKRHKAEIQVGTCQPCAVCM